MIPDTLQKIQKLQFTDKSQAESLLLSFISSRFPYSPSRIELRPSPISLNSFNGFMHFEDGTKLFFKTHTESDTVIDEYYSASKLADAGYPIIKPVFSSTDVGEQFLVYEVIEAPSVFDVAWETEIGEHDIPPDLKLAQNNEDKRLFDRYLSTLQYQSASDSSVAPIHQLFYHRLTGGRLSRFYGVSAADFSLPDGSKCSMNQIRKMRWEINGRQYADSLESLIERSIRLLDPVAPAPAVIGHGDAHNGNVFLVNNDGESELLYFDPAFAGRHHPILDLVKPLFHNVFAMWMYFPTEKRDLTNVRLEIDADLIRIDHDYQLHPIRHMFLESKIEHTLVPILRELRYRGWLRHDWREYLKSALFCCPFLTMNLGDNTRFPPEIAFLGLATSIEMGSWIVSGETSFLDRRLEMIQLS